MKVTKLLKRLFFLIIFLLIIIICAAIAIPFFYKDEIISYVKKDVNKVLDAEVDFKDVSLSLFRSFPDLSFNVKNFAIDGKNDFEGVRLAHVEDLDLSFNLMSVIKSAENIEINSITLDNPEIYIKVLPNDKANYDIAKDSGTADEASAEPVKFVVNLQKYNIKNAQFVYDDKATNTFLKIKNLNHSGKGDFTQNIFDVVTKTTIEELTASSGGVKYLSKAKTDFDITLNADIANNKFTLKDNELLLNSLKLNADGTIALDGDDINVDLKFDSPGDNFSNLLSLLPSAYTKDFANIKADGKFKFNGFTKGTFNAEKEKMPAFKVNLEVNDANFKYPDLPMSVNNIHTVATINSPSSDFDQMTIDVPEFKMVLGSNPFEAKFKLKTPMSDPNIDAKMKGIINLSDFSKAFPMEGVNQLSGTINADVVANTSMSAIEKQKYEEVDMAGDFKISDLVYNADGMPRIILDALELDLSPKHVNVSKLDARLGKSDLKGQGKINNILAYFSPDKTMKGEFLLRSNYFDANEWISDTGTAADSPDSPAEETTIFDRFDFALDAQFKTIDYDVYKLNNTIAKGSLTPSKFILEKFSTKIGNSDFAAKGQINNIFDYLFENQTLTGNIAFNSDYLDLNQFMEEDPGAVKAKKTNSETEYGTFLVPENIDIDIDANIGKVKYTNMELKDVNGKIDIKDEQVQLNNVSGRTLGGKIIVDGGYDTRNKEKPAFDFGYNIQGFSFQETFNKLNTIQQLAPLMRFIDGKFNSNFKINGLLGDDMMPDLGSLNADGFLHTLKGVIRHFKPLEEIGNKLNVSEFKSLEIKDTKNWFELKDGTVFLKDFDYKYKNIDMKIGGKHSLTAEMDYNITAKVPRKYMDSNPVGQAANTGLDWLRKEASKVGVNVNKSEFFNVAIKLTGDVAKPKVSLKFLGTEGQSVQDTAKDAAKQAAEAAVDKAKEEAQKRAEEAKNKLEEEVRKRAEEAKEKARKELEDKLKDKVKDEVKDKVEDKAEEILGDKKDEVKDQVKDQLDKFNPFKKKKKDKEKEGGGE